MPKKATTEIAEIVCAFGDIRGYTKWMEKVTRATQVSGLVSELNAIFKKIAKKNKCFYKRTGDGCFLVFQLRALDKSKRAVEALRTTWQISQEVLNTLGSMEDPRPKGFRVRLDHGFITGWKEGKEEDYYGKEINRCFRDLKKFPRERHVCTKEVKMIVKSEDASEAGLTFSKLNGTHYWRFTFKSKEAHE